MRLMLVCPCGNELPGSSLNRRYCEKCRLKRRADLYRKNNHKKAGVKAYDRIKVNLFKSWVIMFEVKRN